MFVLESLLTLLGPLPLYTLDCRVGALVMSILGRLRSSSQPQCYDVNLPIHMAGDASQFGVGAVISHMMPDWSERTM